MSIEKYLRTIFLILSAILIFLCLIVIPLRFGDGAEYLGMTISFINHGTPNLTEKDIVDRASYAMQWQGIGWNLRPELDHSGYYKALNGKEYCYHFWFYSLLSAIPFIILKLLGANPLKLFQLTNALLVILLFWRLVYDCKINLKLKLWLIFVLSFSPLWFYVPWSHPEVFSFVFFFMGLIDAWERKWPRACLLLAIASLQNPPIVIGIPGVILTQLYHEKKLSKNILYSVVCGAVSILPFVFYWFHFHVLSLVAVKSTSVDAFSIDKVLSLFIDPNFGLMVYYPLLLAVLFYLVVKKEKDATLMLLLMLLISAVCATQWNWNGGMMYINRYAYWLAPPLIMGTLSFFMKLSTRKLAVYSLVYIFTTGLVTLTCLLSYNGNNYVRFSPVSRVLLATIPSIYNPPYEVFAERALGEEVTSMDKLPIEIANSGGIRKVLVNYIGLMGYINAGWQLSTDLELFCLKKPPAIGEDIFDLNSERIGLKGWYSLEKSSADSRWRYTDENSEIFFLSSDENPSAIIQIILQSFNKNRGCKILLNQNLIYIGVIPSSLDTTIKINTKIPRGFNRLSIVSLNPAEASINLKELNNNDTRKLAFCVTSISIK